MFNDLNDEKLNLIKRDVLLFFPEINEFDNFFFL